MIELTEDQRRELETTQFPRAIDPLTKRTYILVSEDLYQRVFGALADEFSPRDAYPAIDRAFREGWDDPKMDDYDRYEDLKR